MKFLNRKAVDMNISWNPLDIILNSKPQPLTSDKELPASHRKYRVRHLLKDTFQVRTVHIEEITLSALDREKKIRDATDDVDSEPLVTILP